MKHIKRKTKGGAVIIEEEKNERSHMLMDFKIVLNDFHCIRRTPSAQCTDILTCTRNGTHIRGRTLNQVYVVCFIYK